MSSLVDTLVDEIMQTVRRPMIRQCRPCLNDGWQLPPCWRSTFSWRLYRKVCERRKASHRREDAPNEANDQKHAHGTILKQVRLIGREIVGRRLTGRAPRTPKSRRSMRALISGRRR